jgi:hypothetical protein
MAAFHSIIYGRFWVITVVPDLAELLRQDHESAFEKLRRSEGTGRPAGAEEFVLGLEKLLKRPIARRSPGEKACCLIRTRAVATVVLAAYWVIGIMSPNTRCRRCRR